MSNNAVLSALRRMDISGDEMTGHGFRATARTIGAEVLGFRPDLLHCKKPTRTCLRPNLISARAARNDADMGQLFGLDKELNALPALPLVGSIPTQARRGACELLSDMLAC
jgi:hypothetical protein